jgi:hypothetical protein
VSTVVPVKSGGGHRYRHQPVGQRVDPANGLVDRLGGGPIQVNLDSVKVTSFAGRSDLMGDRRRHGAGPDVLVPGPAVDPDGSVVTGPSPRH